MNPVDTPLRNLASKYDHGPLHMPNGMEDAPNTLRIQLAVLIGAQASDDWTKQARDTSILKHRSPNTVGPCIVYFLNLINSPLIETADEMGE